MQVKKGWRGYHTNRMNYAGKGQRRYYTKRRKYAGQVRGWQGYYTNRRNYAGKERKDGGDIIQIKRTMQVQRGCWDIIQKEGNMQVK